MFKFKQERRVLRKCTCNSDRQNVTSWRRSPILRSASRCVKTVLSSRSLISLTASFLTLSELFLALSALLIHFTKIRIIIVDTRGGTKITLRLRIDSKCFKCLPVVMTHIWCWPIGWWISCIICHSCSLKIIKNFLDVLWSNCIQNLEMQ